MTYGKLRIAWSVAWGIACTLLVVLWVRSYSYCDNAAGYLGPHYNFSASTQRGDFGLAVWGDSWNPGAPRLAFSSAPAKDEPLVAQYVKGPLSTIGIRWLVSTGFVFLMPLWWPLLVFTIMGVASWSRCTLRFSLRALLIVATLVAMVLGLFACLRG